MPFVGAHENDIAMETADGPVCTFDCENGKIKSGEEATGEEYAEAMAKL